MTSNAFLDKVLASEYSKMSAEDYKVMAAHQEIFDVGAKFSKIVSAIEKSGKEPSEDDRAKLMEIIESKLPPALFVLNRMDDYTIQEAGYEIDFKARFIENVSRMNNVQICLLIDAIGKVDREHHISIFGSMANEPGAYHAINGVISKAYGLTLVFDVFGRKNERKFENLELSRFDKSQLISAIRVYCKSYFYLLEGISEVILEAKEDELSKYKLTHEINKKLGIYFGIIDKQHELLKQKGKKGGDTLKFMIDRVYADQDEEDD